MKDKLWLDDLFVILFYIIINLKIYFLTIITYIIYQILFLYTIINLIDSNRLK